MRLTDQRFFNELLNDEIEELRAIKQLVQSTEDYQEARKLFASYIRKNIEPERYLAMPYQFEGNVILYPNEQEAEAAERIIKLELISTGTPYQFNNEVDWEFNPTSNQYREWTWQLNRHAEFRLLAHQYLVTGKDAYAETFVKLVKSWMEQAVVPEQAHSTQTKCWRTIETGIRSSNWMYALHVFIAAEQFDDETLVDFYKSLWEHGWRLRNFYSNGNWLLMEMNGLCQIGLICSVFKEAKEWRQHAIQVLEEQLDIQIYPDGFHFELSTGYHHTIIENYLKVIKVFSCYNEPVPASFLNRLEKVVDLNLKLVMPNGIMPNLNDGSWAKIEQRLAAIAPYYPDREDWKWYISNGKEGVAPEYHTEILPYAGVGVLRKKEGDKSYYGLIDVGPFGKSHQHEDKLNIIINCYDKVLISEGGNYAYDDSEMRNYVLSTRSHNTIRIDGMDQNRRMSYQWEPEYINQLADMKWECNDKVEWVEGIYQEGYGEELIKVEHRRKLIFIKELEELDPFFIVVDRIVPQDSKQHAYEILWHLKDQEINVDGLQVTTLDQDGKNICIQAASVKGMDLHIIKGQETPEFQGWLPYNRGLQGEYESTPTLQYTGSVEKGIRVGTLLYPLYQKECPIHNIEVSESIESKSIKLILNSGEVIKIKE